MISSAASTLPRGTSVARGFPRRSGAAKTPQSVYELGARGKAEETPKILQDVLDFEARMLSWLDFIPLVGPWLLYRRGAFTNRETETRFAESAGFSLLIVIVAYVLFPMLAPSPRSQLDNVRQQVQARMRGASDVLTSYHGQNGHYPDAATWQHLAAVDPRAVDPWGRLFHYELTDEGTATLTTFGRDGLIGGEEEDADVSVQLSSN